MRISPGKFGIVMRMNDYYMGSDHGLTRRTRGVNT